jgi:hypothetical protein
MKALILGFSKRIPCCPDATEKPEIAVNRRI